MGHLINHNLLRLLRNLRQQFSTVKEYKYRVGVCGASSEIGQPLCLLLKQCPLIKELRIYDIAGIPGVTVDLSHIETSTKVTGFMGCDNLDEALENCDVVIIPSGLLPHPARFINAEDLFNTNAGLVRNISSAISRSCPKAMIGILTYPINATVPVCAKVLMNAGVFDPRRLFGVSSLDTCRANTFIAQLKGLNAWDVHCPVVGGHSANTVVPVISQCIPKVHFTDEQLQNLVKKIREANQVVVEAKNGTGASYLSTAYAGARFTVNLLRALSGEQNIIECSYVYSSESKVKYFLTPVLLGKNGIDKNFGIPKLSNMELNLLQEAIPHIEKYIERGERFVTK